MAMRETVRSLRAYFILGGLATFVGDFLVTLQDPSVIPVVIRVITAAFALAFLYVGIALPRLLRRSVDRVIMLLYVSAGWSVLNFLLDLTQGFSPAEVGFLVVGLLILWYLLRNVRRLAAEAQVASPEVAP